MRLESASRHIAALTRMENLQISNPDGFMKIECDADPIRVRFTHHLVFNLFSRHAQVTATYDITEFVSKFGVFKPRKPVIEERPMTPYSVSPQLYDVNGEREKLKAWEDAPGVDKNEYIAELIGEHSAFDSKFSSRRKVEQFFRKPLEEISFIAASGEKAAGAVLFFNLTTTQLESAVFINDDMFCRIEKAASEACCDNEKATRKLSSLIRRCIAELP